MVCVCIYSTMTTFIVSHAPQAKYRYNKYLLKKQCLHAVKRGIINPSATTVDVRAFVACIFVRVDNRLSSDAIKRMTGFESNTKDSQIDVCTCRGNISTYICAFGGSDTDRRDAPRVICVWCCV